MDPLTHLYSYTFFCFSYFSSKKSCSPYISRRHRYLLSFNDQLIKFDAIDPCSSAYYAQNMILNILSAFYASFQTKYF